MRSRVFGWPKSDGDILLEAAKSALERIKARSGEDVEVWAARLAKDLAKFTD